MGVYTKEEQFELINSNFKNLEIIDNQDEDVCLDKEWLLANKDALSTKLQELYKHYSETNDDLSLALDVKDIVCEV